MDPGATSFGLGVMVIVWGLRKQKKRHPMVFHKLLLNKKFLHIR